jgi:glycogen operon protein
VFRRRRFFGSPLRGEEEPQDIGWFTPEGSEMTSKDWDSGFGKSMAVYLNGEGIHEPDVRGQRIVDDSFLMLFNAHHEPIEFSLLGADYAEKWEVVLDTADHLEERADELSSDGTITVADRGTIVLRKVS